MSRFLSSNAAALSPYIPGEQPRDRVFIKLNTNESPYPPAPGVQKAIAGEAERDFALYPDPEATALRQAFARRHSLSPDQVFVGNGSDEVLAFAYMAFFDRGDEIVFPHPSYGFYPVYAGLFGLGARAIPLAEDYSIRLADYQETKGHILIANPNAPTGMALTREEIEKLLAANPHRLVIVDEAYAAFAEDVSCLPLLERYDNLLVIGTFSKSMALAGLRLGYAFSRPEQIAALERVKYSFNPYNVNRLTQLAGVAAVEDEAYHQAIVGRIKATRSRVTQGLEAMGVRVLPSSANFIFASHPRRTGGEFAGALREKGILVRHFVGERTEDFVRVSMGTEEDMELFLKAVEEMA